MPEKLFGVFKRGDRFQTYATLGSEATGKAGVMIADVKPRGETEKLATLDIAEVEGTPGKYYMDTDADTSGWPACVCVDIWYTDIQMHDPVTMLYHFEEAITDARETK